MSDGTTTVAALREAMRQFVAERDWEQFHSPKNLVMGLSVETAELMEHYLWMDPEASRKYTDDPQSREAVADEIADVALYLFALANVLNLDLSDAVRAKLVKTRRKYPAERYRGQYRIDEPKAGDSG